MTAPLQKNSKPLTSADFEEELNFAGLRFKDRAVTEGVTLHCSATKPSQDFTSFDIDRMHRNRGFLCIGYHFVIGRDGVIYRGRPINARGAHCKNGGRNNTHVGVCLIGGISENPQEHVAGNPWNGSDAEANFTPAQAEALVGLMEYLMEFYTLDLNDIEGHRDVAGVRKACPSFDVEAFKEDGEFRL